MIRPIFAVFILFVSLAFSFAQIPQEVQTNQTPFWRVNPFGSQALNPDISLIGDFLLRPGTRDADKKAFSLREAELGIQAVVDPYSRADIFIAVEEEGNQFEVDIEEAFLTLLSLPSRSQGKLGRYQVDFGRTHRTHAPERDFVDTPLVFDKVLGVEKAMKANGGSFNVLIPLPLNSYHELRTEIGETKVQFGEEDSAIKRTERFVLARQKNFFSIGNHTNLELSGGFGRFQTEGNIEKVKSTSTFEGRSHDLIRSVGSGDFTIKWKPGAYRSAMLEGNFIYSISRPLSEDNTNGGGKIVHFADDVHDRGGFVHLQIQPWRRWFIGSRADYVLNGINGNADRLYAGILTFFPSEFLRFRFQWNRKDSDGALREHRFFLQLTWALGPHRPHPF